MNEIPEDVMSRLVDAQRSLNIAAARRREFIAHYGPVGPGSRRLRVRHWFQRRYWSVGRSWRTWLASRVAPWLDD